MRQEAGGILVPQAGIYILRVVVVIGSDVRQPA